MIIEAHEAAQRSLFKDEFPYLLAKQGSRVPFLRRRACNLTHATRRDGVVIN
jgi:hypothetical protein|tara:strand:+ start:156 stop:311 length:156 start_codon:yes stop_codon:yes gene_type:complete